MKYTNILILFLFFLFGKILAQQDQWKIIWDKNSDSDSVTYYIVYRGIGTIPTVNDSFCIALHPNNTNQDSVMIIDSLLEKDIEYFYSVVAIDSLGRRSGFSRIVSEYNGEVSSSSDLNTEIRFPQNHELFQNYPNPFNPFTTIEFTLPKPGYVELRVFNILGIEIAEIVSDNLPAGVHQYQFDGSNLASGIYYYEIVAGEFIEVKKMILLR